MSAPRTRGNRAAQGKAEGSTNRHATKSSVIAEALLSGSLNRFEAERIGDHTLNSTVSALRARGVVIDAAWEEVPTRFGKPVRVKRYSIPRSQRRKAREILKRRAGRVSPAESR